MRILQSASKLVFVLMAVSLVVLTFVGKVDPKDFIVLASMAFTFYFTKPQQPSSIDTQ